ncbi:hypothetical protein KSP39_PZI010621 [Platanthera zijinensis]|uniref:Uncharacterized protein n=1 Tax=Platanthera zijinensis TaxID=2320716 RepID=A0AAP0G6T3_9ASPA
MALLLAFLFLAIVFADVYQFCNQITLKSGTKKTLIMSEIPEDSVKKLLSNKESLTACDIVKYLTTPLNPHEIAEGVKNGTKKTLIMSEIPEDSVKKLLSNKESLTACDIVKYLTTPLNPHEIAEGVKNTFDPTKIVRRPSLLRQEVWIYKASPPHLLVADDLDKIHSKQRFTDIRKKKTDNHEIKKTLVMREIPEDSVKKFLSNKESLATCDILDKQLPEDLNLEGVKRRSLEKQRSKEGSGDYYSGVKVRVESPQPKKGIRGRAILVCKDRAEIFSAQFNIHACLFPLEEDNYSDIPDCFLPPLEDTSINILACFLPVEDDETVYRKKGVEAMSQELDLEVLAGEEVAEEFVCTPNLGSRIVCFSGRHGYQRDASKIAANEGEAGELMMVFVGRLANLKTLPSEGFKN